MIVGIIYDEHVRAGPLLGQAFDRTAFMRILIPILAVLAGCQPIPMLPGITPHKIDIQQGNYVTQDMVDKLKPGMSRSQVRFALGTPLIVDPFHADRWDYVYVLQKKGRVVEQRRIVVVFQDDRLTRIDGDVALKGEAPAPGGASLKPAPEPAGVALKPAAQPSGITGKPAP